MVGRISGLVAYQAICLLELRSTRSGVAARSGTSLSLGRFGKFHVRTLRLAEEDRLQQHAVVVNEAASSLLQMGDTSRDPVDDLGHAFDAVHGLRIWRYGERRTRSEWGACAMARCHFISPSGGRGARLTQGGTY